MRKSWDEYFMEMCEHVASRATCDRKHVGTVITRNKRIIATGYNGSLEGLIHCDSPEEFIQCPNCTHLIDLSNVQRASLFHCPSCYQNIVNEPIRKGGHDLVNNSCIRTVHSESNAIAQAAKMGHPTEGCTLYCNTRPCWTCFKLIVSAGIKEVIYRDEYETEPADRVTEAANQLPNFTLRKFKE